MARYETTRSGPGSRENVGRAGTPVPSAADVRAFCCPPMFTWFLRRLVSPPDPGRGGDACFDARWRRVHDRACLVDDGSTGGCQGVPGRQIVVAARQQIDGGDRAEEGGSSTLTAGSQIRGPWLGDGEGGRRVEVERDDGDQYHGGEQQQVLASSPATPEPVAMVSSPRRTSCTVLPFNPGNPRSRALLCRPADPWAGPGARPRTAEVHPSFTQAYRALCRVRRTRQRASFRPRRAPALRH